MEVFFSPLYEATNKQQIQYLLVLKNSIPHQREEEYGTDREFISGDIPKLIISQQKGQIVFWLNGYQETKIVLEKEITDKLKNAWFDITNLSHVGEMPESTRRYLNEML